jgi:hypothetical protein
MKRDIVKIKNSFLTVHSFHHCSLRNINIIVLAPYSLDRFA